MSLRRESPIRGRRLRLDEALMERADESSRLPVPAALGAAYRQSDYPPDKGAFELCRIRQGRTRHDHRCQVRTAAYPTAGLARRLLAIGSNYGRPKHPAWSANLLAHPECTVEFRGPPERYRAELLTGDARAAAWDTAVDVYLGYESYRTSCAPREIRVFRLRPIGA
jgi:deazaflavin-dependent oxidoreductase (nitroreductase family)